MELVHTVCEDLDRRYRNGVEFTADALFALVDEALSRHALESCISVLSKTGELQPNHDNAPDCWCVKGVLCRIGLWPDYTVLGERGLVFKVEPIHPEPGYQPALGVPRIVESLGPYIRFSIMSPSDLVHRHEALLDAASAVFASGYSWLAARTLELLTLTEQRATSRLYAQVRAHLSLELQQQVWLFGVENGVGHYLLDPIAAHQLLITMQRREADGPQSPLNGLLEFATATVEHGKDRFLSLDAIAELRPVHGTFADVKYGEGVKSAERRALGTEQFTVQGILTHGSMGLTAVYPREIEPVIREVLERQASNLRQIIASEYQLLAGIKKRLGGMTHGRCAPFFRAVGNVLYGISEAASN